MTRIGQVDRVEWYEFEDGVFSIHTAEYDDGSNISFITFRCDRKTWPSSLIDPGYNFLRIATKPEREAFIAEFDVELVRVLVV